MHSLSEGGLIEVIAVCLTFVAGALSLWLLRRADQNRERRAAELAVARRAWALKAVVGGLRKDADHIVERMDSLSASTEPKAWLSAALQAGASLDSHVQTLNEVDMSGIDSANVWPLLARLRADVRIAPMMLREQELDYRSALAAGGPPSAALGASALTALKTMSETARGLEIQLNAAYGMAY